MASVGLRCPAGHNAQALPAYAQTTWPAHPTRSLVLIVGSALAAKALEIPEDLVVLD